MKKCYLRWNYLSILITKKNETAGRTLSNFAIFTERKFGEYVVVETKDGYFFNAFIKNINGEKWLFFHRTVKTSVSLKKAKAGKLYRSKNFSVTLNEEL